MEDRDLLDLYARRDEQALRETADKYGKLCYHVAYRILGQDADVQECLNDTWLRAWNSIPPEQPRSLSAYLARISRNLALNTYQANHTQKRYAAGTAVSLDELGEILTGAEDEMDRQIDGTLIRETLNRFLGELPKRERVLFVRRYFYMDSIAELAERFGLRKGNVKVILHRVREKCRAVFEKEGLL